MKDLKFNIYGMARPTTPAELLALMKEFNSEAHILQETLEAIGDACEADVGIHSETRRQEGGTMSTELKQAAQKALDAFEAFMKADNFTTLSTLTQKMNALRTALQQAESEPVGEPRARVELIKTGGNAGLSTRIIELDIATRERLLPGDLLYTRPAAGVPEGFALVPLKATPKVAMVLYEGARSCFSPKVAEDLWQDALTAARAGAERR